jgi:hypothetical protein
MNKCTSLSQFSRRAKCTASEHHLHRFIIHPLGPASEQRGNNVKHFKDLKSKAGTRPLLSSVRSKAYLTKSVDKVVLQKSIPTQIHQLILYISNSKGQADGFVGQLTSAKRLQKHLV